MYNLLPRRNFISFQKIMILLFLRYPPFTWLPGPELSRIQQLLWCKLWWYPPYLIPYTVQFRVSPSIIKVALSVRPELHNHPSPLLSSWSSCVTGGSSSSASRCPQTGGGCWRLTLPGALGLWLSLGPASLPTRTDMIAWCVFTPKIKPARQLGAPLSFPGKASH